MRKQVKRFETFVEFQDTAQSAQVRWKLCALVNSNYFWSIKITFKKKSARAVMIAIYTIVLKILIIDERSSLS